MMFVIDPIELFKEKNFDELDKLEYTKFDNFILDQMFYISMNNDDNEQLTYISNKVSDEYFTKFFNINTSILQNFDYNPKYINVLKEESVKRKEIKIEKERKIAKIIISKTILHDDVVGKITCFI